MSFDLYFLQRPDDGDWYAAMAALGANARAETPASSADRELWYRVEHRARQILPQLEGYDGDRDRELTDVATGLQLFLSPGEIALSVPYWYEGDEADRIVDLLRRVAEAVETETGLTAYDPQDDQPFLTSEGDPARVLDDVAGKISHLGTEPSPSPPPTTAPVKRSWFRRLVGREDT